MDVKKLMPLKDFHPYARPACLYCLDYSADNADIGVGGIGLSGWTFVAVKNRGGSRSFSGSSR